MRDKQTKRESERERERERERCAQKGRQIDRKRERDRMFSTSSTTLGIRATAIKAGPPLIKVLD